MSSTDSGQAFEILVSPVPTLVSPSERTELAESFDARAFRDAAGQFGTGVTIVTTLDEAQRPVGLTANSFTSVSLDPPMVLFCLGKTSDTVAAFDAGHGFVVHVLAADQQDLSNRFASKGVDRFDGTAWSGGLGNLPVIEGALATFECELAHTYEGGDHLIYVGEVKGMSLGDTDRDALGYFRGRYTELG